MRLLTDFLKGRPVLELTPKGLRRVPDFRALPFVPGASLALPGDDDVDREIKSLAGHFARFQGSVPFQTVALVAATAKTVVGLKTPTNQCIVPLEFGFGFDGATSTNAAVIVEFCGNTFATNAPGTNSTSVTPLKQDGGRQETFQTTAGKNWTTEPTVVTQWRVIDIPQYNGFVVMPLKQWFSEIIIPGASGFSVRMTSPNNVNCSGYQTFEE